MDIKKAKEFKDDAIYEINQMITLIDNQAEEIDILKDKIVDIKTNSKGRISDLEGELDDLTESFESHNKESEFDGEFDFYEK